MNTDTSNSSAGDLAAASIAETLQALNVQIERGLSAQEVGARRTVHGYNEVAERREHTLRAFLGKFWGVSAWMLELILILSAVLRKATDFVVVTALLLFNAVLGFLQERRAAGAVVALRQRLQVSSRVLRDARWQQVPARELVPGDVVRVRAGDIAPADVKLMDGEIRVDQSALTGESREAGKSAGDC